MTALRRSAGTRHNGVCAVNLDCVVHWNSRAIPVPHAAGCLGRISSRSGPGERCAVRRPGPFAPHRRELPWRIPRGAPGRRPQAREFYGIPLSGYTQRGNRGVGLGRIASLQALEAKGRRRLRRDGPRERPIGRSGTRSIRVPRRRNLSCACRSSRLGSDEEMSRCLRLRTNSTERRRDYSGRVQDGFVHRRTRPF